MGTKVGIKGTTAIRKDMKESTMIATQSDQYSPSPMQANPDTPPNDSKLQPPRSVDSAGLENVPGGATATVDGVSDDAEDFDGDFLDAPGGLAGESAPPADGDESPILELQVPESLHGKRLDRAAADLFQDYSRARLQRWIEDGHLLRNGVPAARLRDAVASGDVLRLQPPRETENRAVAQAIELDVLYADETLAVINKPAGLTVHPGAGCPDGTLQNALLHRFPQTQHVPRAGIVHRLDKDTTGVMVVALTLEAHTRLVAALAARTVRREYEALVAGAVTSGNTVDAPIGRDPRNRLKMAVVRDGRHAVTHFRVLERFRYHTLLRVRLETGRTHQIRVHMAHLRYPIVGDTLYGGGVVRGEGLLPALREQLLRFPRQALHARELAFAHPRDGREMCFEAPLPADFVSVLEALRAQPQGS